MRTYTQHKVFSNQDEVNETIARMVRQYEAKFNKVASESFIAGVTERVNAANAGFEVVAPVVATERPASVIHDVPDTRGVVDGNVTTYPDDSTTSSNSRYEYSIGDAIRI